MLQAALNGKHASVGILYFYQKEKDADLIYGDISKIKIGKITPEEIQQEVERTIGDIGRDNRIIESGDNKAHEIARVKLTTPIPKPISPVIEAEQEVAATVLPEVEPPKTLEQRIREMGEFANFGFFKEALRKDVVLAELMDQNTEYAGLVNMLEAYDREIASIFQEANLPAEQRFEMIKAIGIDRSTFSGMQNSIVADKLAAIMEAIVSSAEATVERRIESLREALGVVTSAELLYDDHGKLEALIDARMRVQVDLMELSKEIIEVYMAMDKTVTEQLDGMGAEYASDNVYINEIMQPLKPLFLPRNIAAVTNKLIGDLHKKRVVLSIVEEKIKKLVDLVFKLCEEDATIIDYQQKLIRLLMAQRVENVVVVDHVIKYCLRIFVGPADTGRTATALTWSGIVSRRKNTLLLDLTGNSKLSQYGVEPVELNLFLKDRLERQFICVEGNLEEEGNRVEEVVAELKTRLHYYAHVHILLDAGQTELLNRLAKSALSVHFLTDCTPRGNRLLKTTVEHFRAENVASKAILIDPPLDPHRMLADLSLDPLMTKAIILPRMQYIRACSLNQSKPYESWEVAETFEEAFR
ncbi:hypothetical protein [Cohnella cholangitidis]|uniref:Uncharacterized protein n=1 Tax=Cohnella cholangitidis TaxID=2598458 RepID=A0A7G5BU42_9BACL|nr:hypothetical protein [Cohnella cholangitidis]QMV40476.1 hypothetical protein FPL14_04105 [Cohnella cholangitidis]